MKNALTRQSFYIGKKKEENLSANNVWTGLQNITDYKMTHQKVDSTDRTLPDKLNTFYSRFAKS
ncbi:hypothetical protein ACXWOM_10120, partial [Streptococcus pyogenes]